MAGKAMLDGLVHARQDAGAAPRPAPVRAAPSFADLPGLEEIRLQRHAGEQLGLADPFFLVHDGRAGAETEIGGRRLVNFSSYDYLGLNGHPAVAEAAARAMERFGTSASASRVVAGERPGHRTLEAALARHYGTEDCLVMVSGHATNVSALGTLLGPADWILHDSLIHNSVVTGAALSRAKRRSFPHNDLAALGALLDGLAGQPGRVLVVVEGLYSMDGDAPDLAGLVALKRRHGFWLMVDDAHGLGTLGSRGRGLFEHAGVDPAGVDIWMGTLSKTLASCGGYIAGCRDLVDFLKHSAGGFVYSVGLSPPLAAAAEAALALLHAEPERVARLQRNGERFVARARAEGLDAGPAIGRAVVPLIVGDSVKAVALSERLSRRGINVQPIIHPAVPERASRLRFFVGADHTLEQIDAAVDAAAAEMPTLDGAGALLARRGLRL